MTTPTRKDILDEARTLAEGRSLIAARAIIGAVFEESLDVEPHVIARAVIEAIVAVRAICADEGARQSAAIGVDEDDEEINVDAIHVAATALWVETNDGVRDLIEECHQAVVHPYSLMGSAYVAFASACVFLEAAAAFSLARPDAFGLGECNSFEAERALSLLNEAKR